MSYFFFNFLTSENEEEKNPGKLACFSLTNTFTLAYYFLSKSAAYPSRVSPFKAPLPNELIKIGCKFMTEANTLAYYSTVIITVEKVS